MFIQELYLFHPTLKSLQGYVGLKPKKHLGSVDLESVLKEGSVLASQ